MSKRPERPPPLPLAAARLQAHQGHFCNPVLVRSQFESPELSTDETGASSIDGNEPVGEMVEGILGRLPIWPARGTT